MSITAGQPLNPADENKLSVGRRCCYNGNILGKIIGRDGGLVFFATPHGTLIHTGIVDFVRCSFDLTLDQNEQLTQWEKDAPGQTNLGPAYTISAEAKKKVRELLAQPHSGSW